MLWGRDDDAPAAKLDEGELNLDVRPRVPTADDLAIRLLVADPETATPYASPSQ